MELGQRDPGGGVAGAVDLEHRGLGVGGHDAPVDDPDGVEVLQRAVGGVAGEVHAVDGRQPGVGQRQAGLLADLPVHGVDRLLAVVDAAARAATTGPSRRTG